jgi:hypothetical protein
MQISKGKHRRPRRVVLIGTKGIGKSTWANQWPRPLFGNLEDGLDNIDCEKTPWLKSHAEVLDMIGWLLANQTPYGTIVIDSADWLESLIFKQVAANFGKESVDAIGYSKGFQSAADMLDYILRGLDRIRIEQNKHIVFLAHEQITKFSPPGGDAYERYSIAMHKETAAVLTEWCDEVLFAHYKTFTKATDLGFGKERHVAMGGTQRIITTRETAAIVAKNRLDGIPEEIDMEFSSFAKWLPQLDFAPPQPNPFNAATLPDAQPPSSEGNISGKIVNGHNVKELAHGTA